MEKSIRVTIQGRDYALRVRPEDETDTRKIVAALDERLRQFQQAHPEQPELTTAVIVALGLAEELHAAQEAHEQLLDALEETLDDLGEQLDEALDMGELTDTAAAPSSAPLASLGGEPSASEPI